MWKENSHDNEQRKGWFQIEMMVSCFSLHTVIMSSIFPSLLFMLHQYSTTNRVVTLFRSLNMPIQTYYFHYMSLANNDV